MVTTFAKPKSRQCFCVSTKFIKNRGYVVGIVTEGKPGYQLTGGNGTLPYVWSADRNKAQKICDRKNREVYGLSVRDVLDIITSSMTKGN